MIRGDVRAVAARLDDDPYLSNSASIRKWTLCQQLPWQSADYGQSNTIILVNLPRGEHKVLIEGVDPEGRVLTAQTVMFKSPGR